MLIHLNPGAETELALQDLCLLRFADRVLATGAVAGRDLCREKCQRRR
jgi:hypothetical protein